MLFVHISLFRTNYLSLLASNLQCYAKISLQGIAGFQHKATLLQHVYPSGPKTDSLQMSQYTLGLLRLLEHSSTTSISTRIIRAIFQYYLATLSLAWTTNVRYTYQFQAALKSAEFILFFNIQKEKVTLHLVYDTSCILALSVHIYEPRLQWIYTSLGRKIISLYHKRRLPSHTFLNGPLRYHCDCRMYAALDYVCVGLQFFLLMGY